MITGNDNHNKTKVDCTCDKCIIVDERVFSIGYRCIKCGLSADHRIREYLHRFTETPPILTEPQRQYLRLQVKIRRADLLDSNTVRLSD